MIGVSCLGSYGRLGNQMFQYAAAYSLAIKHGVKVSISSKDTCNNRSQLVETFELESAVLDEFSEIKYRFHEKDFRFEDISNLPDQTDIVGYFQSEQYFALNRNAILASEFKFRRDVLENADSAFQNLKSDLPVCSIHVRRGDYLKLSATHPTLDLDYYEKAVARIPELVELAVFSDDIQEARTLIESSSALRRYKKKYVSQNYATELCLMSKCDYHVIANSSFSWWGAWLSESKMVVAPNRWFGPSGPKTWKDVYCKGWETA